MKVIVCGDSFNCNDALYPGVHWTEKIVQLNSSIDLTNLSICGASNLLIHLESELKSSMEAQLELAEIGRRAIEIRNFNNKRIQLKNAIAEKLGCSVREIKAQHISK